MLEKIALATASRIERAKREVPLPHLQELGHRRIRTLDFEAAFLAQGAHVIAEVKLKSPSEGAIAAGADPVQVALDYERNGAAAVSVLTEPDFFGGSVDSLARIRERAAVPLLMKDFFIDPYQFAQARAFGADAALLIAALLGDRLSQMLDEAAMQGLASLVEVHNEAELERALKLGARLIGVNNRDLKTLSVSLDVSRRLASAARGSKAILVAESGIASKTEIEELAALGFRGFLIGTSFMKTGAPGKALAELLGRTPA